MAIMMSHWRKMVTTLRPATRSQLAPNGILSRDNQRSNIARPPMYLASIKT